MPPPSLEVADILRQHGDAYRQAHAFPLHQWRLLQAIENCRTAAPGRRRRMVRPLPKHAHRLSPLPRPPLSQVSRAGMRALAPAAPRRTGPAVERLQCQDLQDEEVQGTLDQVGWFAHRRSLGYRDQNTIVPLGKQVVRARPSCPTGTADDGDRARRANLFHLAD